MSFVVVTPPDELAVSIEEMKRHLRVDHDDDDDMIGGLVAAAQAGFEAPEIGWLGRPVALQEIEIRSLCFGHKGLSLFGPVIVDPNEEMTLSVTYGGVAVNSSVYSIDTSASLFPQLLPLNGFAWRTTAPGGLVVRYWAGFGPDDPRIGNFKSAIKLKVEMDYDGVEDSDRYQKVIETLLDGYRLHRV